MKAGGSDSRLAVRVGGLRPGAERAGLFPASVVRGLVRGALPGGEFPGGGEVSLRFVGRDEMAELNAKFRGRPGPTDVLSFLYENGQDGRPALGDIAVCLEVVRENARADGAKFADSAAHAIVHGALHLAGRRHDTADAAKRMAADEARILGECGFARPGALDLKL